MVDGIYPKGGRTTTLQEKKKKQNCIIEKCVLTKKDCMCKKYFNRFNPQMYNIFKGKLLISATHI